MESFHGSAISITQHIEGPSEGILREIPIIENISTKCKLKDLPQSYTTVFPLSLKPKDLFPPILICRKELGPYDINSTTQNEISWLEQIYSLYQKGELSKEGILGYVHLPAYHASLTLPTMRPRDTTALLPLFREQAHTPAMVIHAMKIALKQIEFLNPGQTPVLAMDQPLFALAKTIQWEKPDLFGEDKFVAMI